MICPKCFTEFESFHYEEKQYNSGKAKLCVKSEELDLDVTNEETASMEFSCPNCNEVLFNDYYEAKKFALIQKDTR